MEPLFANPHDVFKPEPDRSAVFATLEGYESALQSGKNPADTGNGTYRLVNGHLHHRVQDRGEDLLVAVPTSIEKAEDLVRKVHLDLGHLGITSVTAALRRRAWIPFATEIIDRVVRSCDNCQFTRREVPVMLPLHPLPRVDAGDVWSFDFVGPLPRTTNGNQYLLTGMDLGTDFTLANALQRRAADSVINLLRYVIATYGKPKAILTDNGEEFMAYVVQNFLRRLGIEHLHTTPYHPQTNGRLEKFNDTLVQMLARVCAPNSQNQWDEYLPDVLLAHHAHVNPSLRASPFYLMHGREPRLPHDHVYDVVHRPPTDQEIEAIQVQRLDHVKDLGRFRDDANERAFARLQDEAAKRDENFNERAIGVGDLVRRKFESPSKLHPRWDGPFIVRATTDKNTYQLQTRSGHILRHLYNGERLRRYVPGRTSDGTLWHASDELRRLDERERLKAARRL